MSIIERPLTHDPLEDIPTLPAEPVTRRDVLLRAAALLEMYGWRAGAMGGREKGFCVLGAVAYAINAPPLDAREMAGRLIGAKSHRVVNWNDSLDIPFPGATDDQLDTEGARAKATAALRDMANGSTWEEATS